MLSTLDVAARSVTFGLPIAVPIAWVLASGRVPGWPVHDALAQLPMVLPPVVLPAGQVCGTSY
jgi:ABC-type molybdate transport system permease subunit